MIFSRQLADLVLSGEKTVTRRRIRHRDGRPFRYSAGRIYAVQDRRGGQHIGHILVTSVEIAPLGWISLTDIDREGFTDWVEFASYWKQLHGSCDTEEPVAVIRFRLAPRCPRCAELI